MDKLIDITDLQTLDADELFVRKAVVVLNASLIPLTPQVTARLDSMRASALATAAALESLDLGAGMNKARQLGAPSLPADVNARLDGIRAHALQRAAQQLRQSESVRSDGSESDWSERDWSKRDKFRSDRSWWAGWRERLGNLSFGVPVSAFASVCVLVTTLAVFTGQQPKEALPLALAEDGLLLASADDIELYENLEFYEWLAENGL